MAQETIILVSDQSDKYLTAQDSLNNNFGELYASSPPSLTGNALKYLRVNAGETALEWATVSGGVTDFTDLGDVPASYSGQALKVARVNAGETGLEFAVIAGTGDVVKVGTPVNNQVGVWTGDGTIEGDTALTFDTTTDTLTTGKAILNDSTASRILSTDGSKQITALGTTTYPSLTELSYVKGVTSSIQTQLNSKGTASSFTDLTDTPANYSGAGLKLVRVNATPSGLEFVTADKTLVGLGNVVNADTTTTANITDSTNKRFVTDAQLTVIGNTSNTNTGDQTSMSGISDTKANFNTACSDGNFLYVGDVTQYTDELAQDAVGAMVDTTLVYTDATPLLSRAALTGAITASAGSNTTSLGSFTTAQLNTALSDNDVATLAGSESLTNKKLGSLTSNGFVKTSGSDGTLSVDTNTYLINTTTAGVGTSPTASQTNTVTHSLGRIPQIIRIYGYGTFTSNAAATPTTSTMGIYCSSGNRCVYQNYNTAAITTTQAGQSSTTFAIHLATGANSFIRGVIQNVGATTFDIVWTETGTATAQVYMWEAQ